MSKRFYLAGACKNVPDGGKEWRRVMKENLHFLSDIKSSPCEVFDPTGYFNYEDNNYISDKQVKEFYLNELKHCDYVILNANDTESSIGTAQEVQYAVDHDIPIIGFGDTNIYNWIKVDCMCIYPHMQDLIQFIGDFIL